MNKTKTVKGKNRNANRTRAHGIDGPLEGGEGSIYSGGALNMDALRAALPPGTAAYFLTQL